MAEYIERKAAKRLIESKMSIVAAMTKKPDDPTVEGYLLGKDHAIDWVEQIPAADVIEVIRCKDCRFYGVDRNQGGFCMRPWSPSMWRNETGELKPNDFCSYAVRKEQT